MSSRLPLKKIFRRAFFNFKKSLEIEIYKEPIDVLKFTDQTLKQCRVSTDALHGGKTTANFLMTENGKSALFSGKYSKEVDDTSVLVRSGFGGFNYKFNKLVDIQPYDYMDVRLRGDGRTYVANVRLEHVADGDEDVWQALIRTKAGEWQDVRLEFRDFVLTFKGRAVGPISFYSNSYRKVSSFGVSFSTGEDDPDEGDFRLEMESVRAGTYRLRGSNTAAKLYEGFKSAEELSSCIRDLPRLIPPPIQGPDAPRPTE